MKKISDIPFVALRVILGRLSKSKIFRDSSWAVLGNGFGNGLLLLAGIIIARLLGRDLYGEYGLAKTTILCISGFATFGLGISSTKYVAKAMCEDPKHLRSIINSSLIITCLFSSLIAICLYWFAPILSAYLLDSQLEGTLKMLGIIIIVKALNTTQAGILAGVKMFDTLAKNNIVASSLMVVSCVPFTYYWGLYGALSSLFLSQLLTSIFNQYYINNLIKQYPQCGSNWPYIKELTSFSFPIALQDSSFTICNWLGILILTKYSSVGEVALYSAAAQWNAVVLMIPSLLTNVILSYLSSTDGIEHKRTVVFMIRMNLICTVIPLILLYILSDYIVALYGEDFASMKIVLLVQVSSTVFECCSSVLRSEFISRGRNWLIFSLRTVRDICQIYVIYLLLRLYAGVNGALWYAIVIIISSMVFFVVLSMVYHYIVRQSAVINNRMM